VSTSSKQKRTKQHYVWGKPGDNIKGLILLKLLIMNLVDTQKLFLDVDMKLFPMLQQVTLYIKELKEGMDLNNISPATPIEGKDRYLAEPLIDMMSTMSKFIDQYKDIKDTWQVTTV